MRDVCPLWICFGSVVCEMLNEDSHGSFEINFGLVWVFSTVCVLTFCMRACVRRFLCLAAKHMSLSRDIWSYFRAYASYLT